VVLHPPLDEAAKLVLDLRDLRRREPARHPRPQGLRPGRLETGPLRRAQQLPEVGFGAQAAARPRGLGDFLRAGPEPRRQEAQIGERAPDGGGLGVLQAGDRVDLAIATRSAAQPVAAGSRSSAVR